MIKEFVQYIEDNTVYTVGTDLFAEAIDPDSIDEAIVVSEQAPGLANGILPDYRQIPLVAYARALTRFTARDNIYVVFDLLHAAHQISLPVVEGPVYVCNLVCSTPYYQDQDESARRYIFAMPIDVTVTNIL